ncbi:hypothetical protein C8F04DRAFT_1235968 [Mycena alexandri]|uniref:Uncharacterized protein n=1 Tax=Mycena alexandri TaxID=1745969 RepID=A0AAD6SP37_9AGAR|nr:hypothetical protein C8F04DRAFT_1235968 [Mycena alexandri]
MAVGSSRARVSEGGGEIPPHTRKQKDDGTIPLRTRKREDGGGIPPRVHRGKLAVRFYCAPAEWRWDPAAHAIAPRGRREEWAVESSRAHENERTAARSHRRRAQEIRRWDPAANPSARGWQRDPSADAQRRVGGGIPPRRVEGASGGEFQLLLVVVDDHGKPHSSNTILEIRARCRDQHTSKKRT